MGDAHPQIARAPGLERALVSRVWDIHVQSLAFRDSVFFRGLHSFAATLTGPFHHKLCFVLRETLPSE